MRKDYHMHPTVLVTPERLESFVQKALQKNIEEICITDHMPLTVSPAADRIQDGRVGEYCRAVRELAKSYEGRISIRCGIEIDFHPSAISEIEKVLDAGDFDFILASSHMHVFINDYPRYTFNDFASAAIENSIKAVEMGWFNAISHPDMYRFVFDNPKLFPLVDDNYDVFRHEALIKELLGGIAKKGMYLEINPHLAESKRNLFYTYPEEPIVKWAIDKGVRFSYGSDAHEHSSVGAYIEELEAHPVYGKALNMWENNV